MKRRKKILVFGFFGYVTNMLDGQTVKTRVIYQLLKEKAIADIRYTDSQEFSYSVLSIFRFFTNLALCDTLIWLPAHNNLRYLFPFIWISSKICHFSIIYVVIGGWLSKILKDLPWHRNHLKKIKAILVENKQTKDELSLLYGYDNIDVIPNFRDDVQKPNFRAYDGTLKLVFAARIDKMKGLEAIANICDCLPNNVTIDFYGPINKEDEDYFFSQLVNRYPFVTYHCRLNPQDINGVLQNYDIMLLPTKFYTEGLPGSIIDAYQAGVPVIVTRWKHANEFVNNGISGYIVDFNNPEVEMIRIISELSDNPQKLVLLKNHAYIESLKYTKTSAWEVLRAVDIY